MNKEKRPLLITIISILLIFAFVNIMDLIYSNKLMNSFIFWYYQLIALFTFVTALGLLFMKKFSVILYCIYAPLSLLVQFLSFGIFDIFTIVVVLFFMLSLVYNFEKMN